MDDHGMVNRNKQKGSFFHKLFLFNGFPLLLQICTFIIFGLLILGGWGISTDDEAFSKILRNTNISNLIVWSYWWPMIIISAVLLGRFWCTMCPVELISFLISRVGLKKDAPAWLKSGWVITIFYAIILLIGIQTFKIHRLPHRMALYLLILIGTSVIVSLIYKKRAFCSYICPVGHLLGIYSMISPFRWGVRQQSVCEKCKTKDCIDNKNLSKLTGRSCTSGLYPSTIQDNRSCLLCTQCVKSCPNNNPDLLIQRPFADFYKSITLSSAQVVFIFMVAGFVVYEILGEFKPAKKILMWVPTQVNESLNLSGSAASFSYAFTMFVIFPAVFALIVYLISRIINNKSTIPVLSGIALLLVPTMAASHIIKAIVKMNSRIPYWSYVFSDLEGVKTAQQIQSDQIPLHSPITNAMNGPITVVTVLLLAVVLIYSFSILCKSKLFRQYAAGVRVLLIIAAIVYWGIFAVTVAMWRF